MMSIIFLEGECQYETTSSSPSPSTFTKKLMKKPVLDNDLLFGVYTSTHQWDYDDSRPRDAAEELGIKEKLFVAVLTSSNTVNTHGKAVVKTLSYHVSEVIVFLNDNPDMETDDIPLVVFEDSQPGLLPIQTLEHIKENLTTEFDFYLFLPDTAYLRAAKYLHLVQHISVKDDIYVGMPDIDINFCALEAGVLMSYSVISQVFSKLDWCKRSLDQTNPSVTLGSCVHQASGKPCSSQAGNQILNFYKLTEFDYDADIENLARDEDFNQAVIFYPMLDDVSHYKLHLYFCQRDLNEIEDKIDEAKAEIIDSRKLDPGAYESLTWPLGAQAPHKPEDQYSVMHWTYFTETHIHLDNEHRNGNKISHVDERDLDDIKNVSLENLNKKYHSRYQIKKLVNGYRRFDSTRGMEYILDLLLLDRRKTGMELMKRVHLLRPLGDIQLVPVTNENATARINIIVPLKPEEVDFFDTFIVTYAISCLQRKEDIKMIVAFLNGNSSQSQKYQKDPFSRPKTMIRDYTIKYNQKGKLMWKVLPNVFSDTELMDSLQSEFTTDALIFMTTVNMEMSVEDTNQFLDRIRINTIKQKQVFFPIGFQQFRPNLIYERKPFPTNVRIGQKLGFWNTRSVEHASFYLSDYKAARKVLTSKPFNIFSMFVTNKKLHVFRAIEPNLRLKWRNMTCDTKLTHQQYEECVTRNVEGLASQRHLALLLYEHLTDPSSKSKSNKVKLEDLIRHW